MSVMVCTGCDRYVDTDFDCEGVWENSSPFRFWCERCVENRAADPKPGDACLAAFKEQDPSGYAELVESQP